MFARRRMTKLSELSWVECLPSLARGGRNSTQLTKFSDRTPSKHVSNNIHIWILHFNCRVQLSYRFTTPMARPIRGREMKKSYVYKIFDTSLCGLVLLNWTWVCIIEASRRQSWEAKGEARGLPWLPREASIIHRRFSLVIGHQAKTCRMIYSYDFFSSIVI